MSNPEFNPIPEFNPGSDSLQDFWKSGAASPNLNEPVHVSFDETPRESVAARNVSYDDIQTLESDKDQLSLDELLNTMLDRGASDLHLTHKLPPMIRVNGELRPLEGYPSLTGTVIESLMKPITSERQMSNFQKNHELDLAYSIPGRSRFRVNMLMQRKTMGAVIRTIPNRIKSTEELNLPDELNKLAFLPRGLVLVTGPTGSGKSTTLAAIIDRANRNRYDHIITVEDPIEFSHENKNCIVTQREVGVDTDSFSNALRAALREDPDIILIGEMRDLETISAAITAAETGHLVFGTLHTQSSAETISRIVDVFPEGSKEQVRQQLGSTIQGIVCQTLVKTLDGGRVAAIEYMKGIPSIKNLIRKGQIDQIPSYIATNSGEGMRTLDQDLLRLVKEGRIGVDDAADKAAKRDDFMKSVGTPEQIAAIRRKEEERNKPQIPVRRF